MSARTSRTLRASGRPLDAERAEVGRGEERRDDDDAGDDEVESAAPSLAEAGDDECAYR